ncbi:unnamed protein product [Lactuca saligna]|uniref:Uncharacterized protein n=1 Tax=Lactuca saligna TaxID=75948 RepID=A0AA35YWV9_LACSI|nr:unnamed protein product [Lactuca saligna]
MGSLDKSKQTSEDLESEHATTSNGNESIANPAIVNDESIQLDSDKKVLSFASCSSSILSDSSPVQDSETQHDKSSLKLKADDQLENPNEESNPSPSIPPPNDHISESPPIQLMERQETPKYRIPSHVFTRKKSTTPGDWSMASNESLFSIPMGSIRLYNQDSFLFEDLDLGYDTQFVDDKTTDTTKKPQINEINNQGSSMLDEHEPKNSEHKEDCQSTADEHTSRFSTDSSSRSFVFPVVARETEKGGSPIGVPEEPKQGPPPPPLPEAEGSEEKTKTKKATPLFVVWFPCFRYYACCS